MVFFTKNSGFLLSPAGRIGLEQRSISVDIRRVWQPKWGGYPANNWACNRGSLSCWFTAEGELIPLLEERADPERCQNDFRRH